MHMRFVRSMLALVSFAAAVPIAVHANTLSAGSTHTVVVKPDGTVWAWGDNTYGQLGDGATASRRVPGPVPTITDAVAVAAGASHTLALMADGSVWAWGYNVYGQLGDGTTLLRRDPVPVLGLTNVTAIAAGDYHSVALTSDGSVWAWGLNSHGQLGIGSTTSANQPALVTLVTGATAIGGGGYHTLAVKNDGTAWAWGMNGNGQLGDGTTTWRTSPVQVSGVTTASGVEGGSNHSLILLTDGTVRAMGLNGSGQIGDGTWTQRTTPVAVSALANVTRIAAGQSSSYGLKADGTLTAWGANTSGRLGDGTTTVRTTPTLVSGPTSLSTMAAGETFALAVTTAGTVWTWGANSAGQLGDGTSVDRIVPIAISGPNYDWKVSTPVFSVAAGTYTTERTVVITAATPGAAIHYTLDGNLPTDSDPFVSSGGSVIIDESRTLKAAAFKTGMPQSDVTAATFTLAVGAIGFSPSPGTYTSPRTVALSTITPGATIRYTLDGSTPTASSALYASPLEVGTSTMIKAIGMRANWSSSAVASGTFTMNFGTLAAPVFSPSPGTYHNDVTLTLSAMPGATIRHITAPSNVTEWSAMYTAPLQVTASTTINARAYHRDYTTSAQSTGAYTLTVATPGLSHISGSYPAGQVVSVTSETQGAVLRYTLNGAAPTTGSPVVPAGGSVAGNFTLKVAAWKAGYTPSAVVTAQYEVTGTMTPPRIAAGDAHSLAIRGDGAVWAWGVNSGRQLGDGTTVQRTLPILVNVSGAVAVSGSSHSLAVRTDGSVYGWGLNVNGQLGDGTTSIRLVPAAVPGTTLAGVAAGGQHTLGLRGDGTVWAFGGNSAGQLGDGTTTQRPTPVQASGLSGITGITAGYAHSLALGADGTIWSWGQNGNGQLGTGTTTGRSSPGQVAGVLALAISAGQYHNLALLADGTVRAWGFNGSGQLGDGTTTQRTTPVTVSALGSITALAAGGHHSLALAGDGTVWAWGANANGQLGDGTTTTRTTPVAVQGLPPVASIAAGGHHSLAIDTNGAVWAWGRNTNGQLGDGTTVDRPTPVMIAKAGMVWKIPTPVLSLATGLYSTAQSVTVTSGDAEAVLHYTTTGADPTDADSIIASGGAIAIPQSLTLKVRAWKPGAVASEVAAGTYELKVIAPVFTPGTGQYGSPQQVAINTATPGASIRYTTDGSEPTIASTVYTAAIAVSDTRTLKARVYKTGWTASDSAPASYSIYAASVATPTIAPAPGTFTTTPLVTLASQTTGATIRYTTDGSDPSATSTAYLFPFLIDRTTTVKARAFAPGMLGSPVASAAYSLDAAGQTPPPVILPGGGRFATRQTVAISGPAGATLRYTTTGIDPTETDPVVPAGGTITVDRAQIVKARAWAAGALPSTVRRADFLITGTVAAGDQHSLGLAADGTVWTWGRGMEGQLGTGAATASGAPAAVLSDGAAVAGGDYYSIAARQDGTVWAWGLNNEGQLGDGSTVTRFGPVQAIGLAGVIAVAAGAQHSLALKSDGTVWAWGHNTFGQLGDGTTVRRTTPVQVIGLRGITSIAAGEGFSMAVQGDGAGGGFVWAWGLNTGGELADGSIVNRSVPVLVPGPTATAQVRTGRRFTVARQHDGTVRAWGTNDFGQLGTLAGGVASSPEIVPGLDDIALVAAAFRHALALDTEGRVWGWGGTVEGQLGTPPYTTTSGQGAPALMPGITGVLDAAAGVQHSLLLRADGAVWATGQSPASGLPLSSYGAQPIPGFALAPNGWLLTDGDADGLPAWREYLAGLDPLARDTNGNGFSDLVDLRRRSQTGNPDDDGDGVPNAVEIVNRTDPFTADSDGDGVSDLLDGYPLDPARSLKPAPDPNDTTPPAIILTHPTSARPIGGGGGQ